MELGERLTTAVARETRQSAALRAQHVAAVAALEEQRRLASEALSPLPRNAVEQIFKALPVDTRLRCREVSRSWRAALADWSYWSTVDLGLGSGVKKPSAALLEAATSRAGGPTGLEEIALFFIDKISFAQLLCVLRKHRQTVWSVNAAIGNVDPYRHAWESLLTIADVQTLIAAGAPALTQALVRLTCGMSAALPLLRCEEPFGDKVHLYSLWITEGAHFEVPGDREVEVFTEALRQRELAEGGRTSGNLGLTELRWDGSVGSVAAFGMISAICVECRVEVLDLQNPELTLLHVPALTRVLQCDSLMQLHIVNLHPIPIFAGQNVPGDHGELAQNVTAFCAGLRAATQLIDLSLQCLDMFFVPADGAAVIRALAGHPTLCALNVSGNEPRSDSARLLMGEALAALIVPDSKLRHLDLNYCHLGDAGMKPLFHALRASHATLEDLDCCDHAMSSAFAADFVLPCVRANTSLRYLLFSYEGDQEPEPSLREAGEIAEARMDDGEEDDVGAGAE